MIGLVPPRPLPAAPPIPPAPAAPDAVAAPPAPPIPFPGGEVDARLKPLQPPSATAATIIREPAVDRPMGASNRLMPEHARWSDNWALAHERGPGKLAPPSARVKTRLGPGAGRWRKPATILVRRPRGSPSRAPNHPYIAPDDSADRTGCRAGPRRLRTRLRLYDRGQRCGGRRGTLPPPRPGTARGDLRHLLWICRARGGPRTVWALPSRPYRCGEPWSRCLDDGRPRAALGAEWNAPDRARAREHRLGARADLRAGARSSTHPRHLLRARGRQRRPRSGPLRFALARTRRHGIHRTVHPVRAVRRGHRGARALSRSGLRAARAGSELVVRRREIQRAPTRDPELLPSASPGPDYPASQRPALHEIVARERR